MTFPPGLCEIKEDWTPCVLKLKTVFTPNSRVFTFGTPDPGLPLGLATCACILARAFVNGEEVIRPYTPVTSNVVVGEFDLMVKIYEDGKMSNYLDHVEIGDVVEFKHIQGNVKVQYPFNKRRIGMLVGGTGLAPMVQALHALLGFENDTTQIDMLYGNRYAEDVLGKNALDNWAEIFSERLHITYLLSREDTTHPDWDGEFGVVDQPLLEMKIFMEKFPAPKDDCLIFICGPPSFYESLCGPRNDPELTGILKAMGFRPDQVVKF
jgi:cytochrome-b5 reductase